jgi:SAM-dependent methyltransferase
MSLARATVPAGRVPPLPGVRGPFPCGQLFPWADVAFELPPGDPRLPALHAGGEAPTPPLDNLVGAALGWRDYPDHMDWLHPDSPIHAAKLLERAMYLHRWLPWLPRGARVLDLGGNIGRFTQWCLDRGCDVELVDPDLRALRRAVGHAAGRPGRLDVHWSTGEELPDLAPVDVVIAAEVLCYVEDPARVLERVRGVLRPGGVLLCSVEARWGWPLAYDAPARTLDALLGDGVLHVPGDRWVRTLDEDGFRALLGDWAVEECLPTHYIASGPLDDAAGALGLDAVLAYEARLRAHPVLRHLNRCWMAVAR